MKTSDVQDNTVRPARTNRIEFAEAPKLSREARLEPGEFLEIRRCRFDPDPEYNAYEICSNSEE
jgi:hypothetical protein